jgi:hypothetical protein
MHAAPVLKIGLAGRFPEPFLQESDENPAKSPLWGSEI